MKFAQYKFDGSVTTLNSRLTTPSDLRQEHSAFSQLLNGKFKYFAAFPLHVQGVIFHAELVAKVLDLLGFRAYRAVLDAPISAVAELAYIDLKDTALVVMEAPRCALGRLRNQNFTVNRRL